MSPVFAASDASVNVLYGFAFVPSPFSALLASAYMTFGLGFDSVISISVYFESK
jgi:hypothetical protein